MKTKNDFTSEQISDLLDLVEDLSEAYETTLERRDFSISEAALIASDSAKHFDEVRQAINEGDFQKLVEKLNNLSVVIGTQLNNQEISSSKTEQMNLVLDAIKETAEKIYPLELTNIQAVMLDNLTTIATLKDFKKIMESNPSKFFRDNINADLDGKGNTLLHLVKNDEIRGYLIAEHKANARARNNEGKTYSGRTDSKEMEFVPNTKPMETLRFSEDVPMKGSHLDDLRQRDIRIGAHREHASTSPTITNKYGHAPALTDEEAKHALPKRPPLEKKLTQYGQLLSDEAIEKEQRAKLERQHSAKLTTLVADDARPKLERKSKLTRADVEIQKLTSNSPLSDEQKKDSQKALNKIRPDLRNLQRDNPRPKLERKERIDLNLPFAAYRLSKLSEEAAKEVEVEAKEKQNKNTGKPTKKSILRDKFIKAKLAAKEGVKKFVDKVKPSSKIDRTR